MKGEKDREERNDTENMSLFYSGMNPLLYRGGVNVQITTITLYD